MKEKKVTAFKYNNATNECILGRFPGYLGKDIHATDVKLVDDPETVYIYDECYPQGKKLCAKLCNICILSSVPQVGPILPNKLMYLPLIENDQVMYHWGGGTFPMYGGRKYVKPFITGEISFFKDPAEPAHDEQAGGVSKWTLLICRIKKSWKAFQLVMFSTGGAKDGLPR